MSELEIFEKQTLANEEDYRRTLKARPGRGLRHESVVHIVDDLSMWREIAMRFERRLFLIETACMGPGPLNAEAVSALIAADRVLVESAVAFRRQRTVPVKKT